MQSGKRLTLKDYFAKHTRTHKNHKNTNVEFVIVNCQVQLFLDNMVLANQNAKLTGPDQGFLVSRLVLTLKPWERGWHAYGRAIYVPQQGVLTAYEIVYWYYEKLFRALHRSSVIKLNKLFVFIHFAMAHHSMCGHKCFLQIVCF